MKKKIILALLLMVFSLFMLSGCSGSQDASENKQFDVNADFNDIMEQAKGTAVSFYG